MKALFSLIDARRIRAAKAAFETPVSGLTDSAKAVAPGSLFFALRGTRIDGHSFIPQALSQGAAAVVVETQEAFEANPQAVWVDSTRSALGEAAARWDGEPTRSLKLVGVTGTNGKTTSAFLLDGIWRALGRRSGMVGTVEYRIADTVLPAPLTTPDALTLQPLFRQMREAQVSHAVMEVSSIALDQDRVAGTRFEIGLFTNFTPDHLDYHGSMESYLAAKARLFSDYAPAASVFNADDPAWANLRVACRSPNCWTFSLASKGADFVVSRHSANASGIRAEVDTPAGPVTLRSPLLGAHNLSNLLGVLAVEYALGGDLARVAQLLETGVGAPGRLERVAHDGERPYVFVDYAHTEDALRNVLQSLRKVRATSGGRIVTVFGCGGDRDRSKRPRMAEVAAELSDVVVATSDNPRTEDPEAILDEVVKGIPASVAYHRDADRAQAIRWALQEAKPGDFVLVAGKGHETYQILGTEKVPFDDREVIRDYYGV